MYFQPHKNLLAITSQSITPIAFPFLYLPIHPQSSPSFIIPYPWSIIECRSILLDLKKAEQAALSIVHGSLPPAQYHGLRLFLSAFLDQMAVHFVKVEDMAHSVGIHSLSFEKRCPFIQQFDLFPGFIRLSLLSSYSSYSSLMTFRPPCLPYPFVPPFSLLTSTIHPFS